MRGDSATLDKGETINFDTYQNTVGLALTHVLTKFNWSPLKASEREESWGREGVLEVGQGWRGSAKSKREMSAKNLQSLVSLLSWQLATLWDTVQRVSTLVQCVESLFTLDEWLVRVDFIYNYTSIKMKNDVGMTLCQKLVIQEGCAR